MISLLKQLCNSPVLLASNSKDSSSAEEGAEDMFQAVRDALPAGTDDAKDTSLNGKLHVLRVLLEHVRAAPEKERVLVVSNSTKCLDRIQALCDHQNWPTLRLQGSTPTAKRLELVDRFNSRRHDDYVFLMVQAGCFLVSTLLSFTTWMLELQGGWCWPQHHWC
jgi:DNA repair and recombination protein RAD54B